MFGKMKEKWNSMSKKKKAIVVGSTALILGASGFAIYRLTGKNVLDVAKAIEAGAQETVETVVETAENVAEM